MFVQIYLLCFVFGNKKALFLPSGRFLIVIKKSTAINWYMRRVPVSGLRYYVFVIIKYKLIII